MRGLSRWIALMILCNRRFDRVAVVAVALILLHINASDKLDPVQIGKTVDAPRGNGLRGFVFRRYAARRIKDALDKGTPHVRVFRSLGTVETDHAPHLAASVGTFQHHELAIQINGTRCDVARGITARPTLSEIVIAAWLDRHAHTRDRCLSCR